MWDTVSLAAARLLQGLPWQRRTDFLQHTSFLSSKPHRRDFLGSQRHASGISNWPITGQVAREVWQQ